MLTKEIQFGPWRVRSEDVSYFLLVTTVLEADGIDIYENIGLIRRFVKTCREKVNAVNDLKQILSVITSTALESDCTTFFGYTCKSVLAKNQYKCFLSRILLDCEASSEDLKDRIVNERPYSRDYEEYLSYLINTVKPFPLTDIDFKKFKPGSGAIAELLPRYYRRRSWAETPVVDRVRLALRHPSRATRAINIPKTWKSRRWIAPEPLLNSLYQGCIADALVRQIEMDTPCRIHDQEQNRCHCRRPYATIDQSNASDRIRLHHIRSFIPEWEDLLLFHRTKFCIIDGEEIPLGTFFATMGSRFSFPVETIIFWRCAAAAILAEGGTLQDLDDLYCYGDDLVVQERYAPAVMRAYELCGFEVNVEKSHYESCDPYRETCGAETFNGIDVKPVRLPRGTRVDWWGEDTDPMALCDFITQLSIGGLWATADLLSSAAARTFGIGIQSLEDIDPWFDSTTLSLPEFTAFSPLTESCRTTINHTQTKYHSQWRKRITGDGEYFLEPRRGRLTPHHSIHFNSDLEFWRFFKVWTALIGYSTQDLSNIRMASLPELRLRVAGDYTVRCLNTSVSDIPNHSLNKPTRPVSG